MDPADHAADMKLDESAVSSADARGNAKDSSVWSMVWVALVVGAGIVSAPFAFSLALGDGAGDGRPVNTDPRAGVVRVWEGQSVFKRCDGTTLVYWGSSRGNAPGPVPDSPECR